MLFLGRFNFMMKNKRREMNKVYYFCFIGEYNIFETTLPLIVFPAFRVKTHGTFNTISQGFSHAQILSFLKLWVIKLYTI